jgi:dihydroxy-acid dehydratase
MSWRGQARQFTANTMATAMELIGLSPMTAMVPQVDPRKNAVCIRGES